MRSQIHDWRLTCPVLPLAHSDMNHRLDGMWILRVEFCLRRLSSGFLSDSESQRTQDEPTANESASCHSFLAGRTSKL